LASNIPGFGHDGQLSLYQPHFIFHGLHILRSTAALLHQLLIGSFLPVEMLLQTRCLLTAQELLVEVFIQS
jgi:hypothetical protein